MTKDKNPSKKASPHGVASALSSTKAGATQAKAQGSGIKSKGGRPTRYTPEVVQEICERLSKGEPLAQICRDEHMPGVTTMHTWGKERPDVAEAIARAREEGEEVIAADCLNIADDNGKDIRYLEDGREVTDADVVQRAKLRIETRLKLLAKWNPKKWGEKVDVTSGGERVSTHVVLPHVPE